MARPPHVRRFVGLAVLFIGLLGIFMRRKGGWALLAALAGVSLGIGGLSLLARGPR